MKRLLLFLLLTVTAGSASAVTYWAAQTQAGANNGSSAADAVNITTLNAHTLTAGTIVSFTGGAAITDLITCHDSGASAANPITYTGDGTAAIYQMNFNGKSYLVIRGLEVTQVSGTPSNAAFYTSTACSNVVIEDCYIHDTYSGVYSDTYGTYTQHVNNLTIRHNSIVNIGLRGGGAGAQSVIFSYGDNLLVEYNYLYKCLDRVVPLGNKFVIRNNYFGPTDTFLFASTSPYPFHTDGGQGYQDSAHLTSQSQGFYGYNYDTDNSDSVGNPGPNGHSFTFQYTSTYSFDHAIYCFNLNIREAQSEGFVTGMSNVWLYNWTGSGYATAYSTFGGRTNVSLSAGQNNAFAFEAGGFITDTNIHVINPIWAFNPSFAAGSGSIFAFFITPTSSSYDRMFIYNASGTYPTNPPGGTNFVTGTNPDFVDGTGAIGHDNYRFNSTSTIKTTASRLTAATNSSTGTSLTVTDAHGIFDGWGTAGDGHLIKIGSGAYVRVTAVNYSSNTVTLAASRTWSSGNDVIVKGMESPGALPYAYAVDFTVALDNATLASGANSLTTTINNPDAVRGVEYLVDGASVGIVYDSPYTQSYTSDGGTHSVEARALPMWPIAASGTSGAGSQPTMTSSSIKTLSPSSAVQAVIGNPAKLRIGAGMQ